MLRRKITEKLLEWKNNKRQECLLVSGAGQVGKTYTIKDFGIRFYESFLEINFVENPILKNIFEKV